MNDLDLLKQYNEQLKEKEDGRFSSETAANEYDSIAAQANEVVTKNNNDRDFMLEAISINPSYLRNASEELKSDLNFLLAAYDKQPELVNNAQIYGVDPVLAEQSVTVYNNAVPEAEPEEKAPLIEQDVPEPEIVQVEPVQDNNQAKIDLLNQYDKEHVEQVINNYSYLKDEDVCLTINNVELTVGDFKERLAELSKEETNEVSEVDEVLINYSNSGYSKNANGEYFNPNIDEYDPDYDPHNDPLFNNIKKSSGKSEDELLLDYIDAMNEMGTILGKEPYPGIEKESLSEYILDDAKKERFEALRSMSNDIKNENVVVPNKYSDIWTQINDIRTAMGKIINKEPYPGIEHENEHAIDYQLDDWEKEQFADLRNQLNAIKEKYPTMFLNSKVEEKEQQTGNVEQSIVDDNPQHAPNPETGYAVDGFQPPAVVDTPVEENTNAGPVDDNPQHAPNPETGYAVDGFQPPAVVDTPVQENQQQPQPQVNKGKEMLKKSLIFAGGFVTGVGLSCVPGVGTIRMGIAAVKVTGAVINVWAKKHPDGKVAQIRQQVLDKIPENIKAGLKNISEKVHASPLNVFVNGVAVGYIAGNVFEMVTGNTVLEAIQDKVAPKEIPTTNVQTNTPSQAPNDQVAQQPTEPVQQATQPAPQSTQPVQQVTQPTTPAPVVDVPGPDLTQIADAVKGGQTIDLSGLEYGLVSSDAATPVHLIQSAGKDVQFLREVVKPDGTVMWAFNQSNGLGYAWFKADDVMNHLAQTGQELVSQGMVR